MPVGAWELEYGCNMLVDPLRTSQYVANAQSLDYCVDGVNSLNPYGTAFTQLNVNCNCDALSYTAEGPGATPTAIDPYTTPALDLAPWYTSLIPESAHFWGFMLEKAEGINNAAVKRSVTDRLNPLGGATLGQLRKGARAIKFTVLAFGAYEAALDYGFRWLGDQLLSQCSQCETCDLTFRTSCPTISSPPTYDEWDTGRWTLKDVGVVEGPTYEEAPLTGAACNVRRITFTMVSGIPHAFKCPVSVLDAESWIPNLYLRSDVLDDSLIWVDSQFSTHGEAYAFNYGSLGADPLFPEHAIYGATISTGEASDPKLLRHTGTNYLYLPGTAGNSVTIPDHTNFDITGNLEMIGRWAGDVSPSTDQYLIMKGSSYATRAYAAVVKTTGHLAMESRDSASAARDATSTSVIPYGDEVQFWWRITVAPATGEVKFYTAADSATEPTTWSQLGTTVTLTAYAASTFLSNAEPITISATGYHRSVKLKTGTDTKLNLNFATAITAGSQITGTEPSSTQTFTINRSASGARSVAVTRSLWLMSGPSFLHVPTGDPLMDFADDEPLTLMTFSRTWADGDQMIAGKMANFASGSAGYAIGTTAAGTVAARLSDGTNNEVSTVPMDVGKAEVHTLVRSATTLTPYRFESVGGIVNGTIEPDSSANLANANALRIGTDSTGSHPYYGEIFSVMLWNRVLTQAEIEEVSQMLLTGGYSYCPPLDWICDDAPSTCASVTNTFNVGEDALIIEIYAAQTLDNVEINITPDTFGYVCDPSTAPADFVAPDPCDTITIPTLPAGYTLRYDATTQRITVTLPGGEVRDGTPYIESDSGTPPSFPTLKCGSFCVCVSSDRCSWLGDASTVSVWTVHRELTI